MGGHIVWALWRAGHEVHALLRPASAPRWSEFLARLHRVFGPPGDGPAPRPVLGDIWLPCCGISTSWSTCHRGRFGALIHCAADTRFHPVRPEDQRRSNVLGTLNALSLAEALGVPRVVHTSTVFVAGRGGAPLAEQELAEHRRFRCPYEESKARAECHARDWSRRCGVPLSILRLGAVVGTGESGSSLTFPHFYGFLRALERFLAQRLPGEQIEVSLSADARLPLVCVDGVSSAVLAVLASDDTPGCLHLCDAQSPTFGEICQTLAGGETPEPVVFSGRHRTPPRGQPFAAWLLRHAAFLSEPPQIETKATEAWLRRHGLAGPRVTLDTVERLRRWWRVETGASAGVSP